MRAAPRQSPGSRNAGLDTVPVQLLFQPEIEIGASMPTKSSADELEMTHPSDAVCRRSPGNGAAPQRSPGPRASPLETGFGARACMRGPAMPTKRACGRSGASIDEVRAEQSPDASRRRCRRQGSAHDVKVPTMPPRAREELEQRLELGTSGACSASSARARRCKADLYRILYARLKPVRRGAETRRLRPR